ncbi:hypothetical protein [Ferruginibacter sp. SUN106]|uniref:hypothetical protein n=1 Tax=Ferruginibacter sp. SUN106 TaxID=2978348 RepID=UPI003D36C761
MKTLLITLLIAFSCKLSLSQSKMAADIDTAVNKTGKTDTKVYRARNPADSINPFKRKYPAHEKQVADSLKLNSEVQRERTNKAKKWPAEDNNNKTPQQETINNNSTTKTLDNNINFSVTSCIGDATAQTVTVFFTFSNTQKVNQLIWVGPHGHNYDYRKKAMAFDNNGNQFEFGNATLGQSTSKYEVKSQLPKDIPVNGSIKFLNVLPSVSKFSLINIPSGSANWNGGGDKKDVIIEVKDINITWK